MAVGNSELLFLTFIVLHATLVLLLAVASYKVHTEQHTTEVDGLACRFTDIRTSQSGSGGCAAAEAGTASRV